MPFDLFLCDIRMPELDGLATIKAWRKIETEKNLSPLPSLALTANAFKEDQKTCLDAGFDDFLAKPLEKDRFLQIVEQYTRKTKIDEGLTLKG